MLPSTAKSAKTVTITVTPTARRPGYYDARLQDGCVIIQASKQPFLDATRALLNRGADPSIISEMWHERATNSPGLRTHRCPAGLLAGPPVVPTDVDAHTDVVDKRAAEDTKEKAAR